MKGSNITQKRESRAITFFLHLPKSFNINTSHSKIKYYSYSIIQESDLGVNKKLDQKVEKG